MNVPAVFFVLAGWNLRSVLASLGDGSAGMAAFYFVGAIAGLVAGVTLGKISRGSR